MMACSASPREHARQSASISSVSEVSSTSQNQNRNQNRRSRRSCHHRHSDGAHAAGVASRQTGHGPAVAGETTATSTRRASGVRRSRLHDVRIYAQLKCHPGNARGPVKS